MSIDKFTPRTGRIMKEDSTTINEADLTSASLGQDGRKFRIGAGTITPDAGKVFIAIQALDDSVITLADAVALPVDSGTILYGRDTTLTVVSGNVVAYQGV